MTPSIEPILPTRAVVLAAGDGGRLGHLTDDLPKPLVQLAGRPLIDYTLEALGTAGVARALVVTGYREAQLRRALVDPPWLAPDLEFASNTRFRDGASLSLAAARDWCGDEPFLLVMSDHLLSASLLTRLRLAATAASGACLVAADRAPVDDAYAAEATRLAIDERGFVRAIGKGLAAWQALDTGAFVLGPAAWEALDAAPEDCELSVIFTLLARRGLLRAADVTGAFWYDIDTPDDLAAAAGLLPASLPLTAGLALAVAEPQR